MRKYTSEPLADGRLAINDLQINQLYIFKQLLYVERKFKQIFIKKKISLLYFEIEVIILEIV